MYIEKWFWEGFCGIQEKKQFLHSKYSALNFLESVHHNYTRIANRKIKFSYTQTLPSDPYNPTHT